MQQDRFSSKARMLAHLATAFMIAAPIGAVMLLASGAVDNGALQRAYQIQTMPADPGVIPLLIWFAVEALRFGLFLWVIFSMRGWLMACAKGAVFAGRTARRVRDMGTGLMLLALAHLVGHTVIVLALTWNNPTGARSLSVSIGSMELLLLLAAGLVSLFGWVQGEAARLSQENQSFV